MEIKKIIILCFLTFIIISTNNIFLVKSESINSHPWPCDGGNPQRTGLSKYNTSHVGGKLSWIYNSSSMGITASPIISKENDIYIGTIGISDTIPSKIFSLNSNGDLIWSFEVGDSIEYTPVLDSNDVIYFGTEDKRFYAIDTKGNLKWKIELHNRSIRSPIIGENNRIYFPILGGDILCLNSDGEKLWEYSTGDKLLSPPALSNNVLYFGGQQRLIAIETDGKLKWSYKTQSSIYGSPAIDSDGNIYFGDVNEYIYSLYPNGTLRWCNKINGTLSSPSIGPLGTIYIPSDDDILYAFNDNGTIKWQYEAKFIIESSPVIGSEGNIYFASYSFHYKNKQDKLFSLNPDGTLRWIYNLDAGSKSSPTIDAKGNIYLTSIDGFVYAFRDERDGNNKSPLINLFIFSSVVVSTSIVYEIRKYKNNMNKKEMD